MIRPSQAIKWNLKDASIIIIGSSKLLHVRIQTELKGIKYFSNAQSYLMPRIVVVVGIMK
jgi:hypothetical protein